MTKMNIAKITLTRSNVLDFLLRKSSFTTEKFKCFIDRYNMNTILYIKDMIANLYNGILTSDDKLTLNISIKAFSIIYSSARDIEKVISSAKTAFTLVV
ncbi:MAG: hypothetical protein ACLU84_07400 [Clostridia bacterium]